MITLKKTSERESLIFFLLLRNILNINLIGIIIKYPPNNRYNKINFTLDLNILMNCNYR